MIIPRLFRALCLSVLTTATASHAAPTLFLNGGASSVSVFDRNTLTEQAYVAAPTLTRSVALSPNGTKAYLVSGGGILVVNALTHLPIGRLPANNAAFVRVSPDGSRLYAANVNGSVWVYDTASGVVVQRVPFRVKDASLYTVADFTISADGSLVALGSLESLCDDELGCPPGDPPALITEIDGPSGTVLRHIPVNYITSLAISGDNSSVYVANAAAILKVDAVSGQTIATIPFAANRITVDAAADHLYAGTSQEPYTLAVFSAADDGSIASVALAGPVNALAFAPDHLTVFAGGCVDNVGGLPFPCPLAAVSTSTWAVQATAALGGSPSDLAVSAGSTRLWVANGSPNELTAVNTSTNRVSGEAETSYWPGPMAVTPSGNKVYTANGDGSISVINGHTLARLKAIQVSQQQYNIVGSNCVSPDGKRAYIALDHLQVIDTGTDQIIHTIPEIPFGCAVSPDSKTLYTYNAGYDEPTNKYRLFVTSYSAAIFTPLQTQNFLSDQLPFRLFVSPDGSALYLLTAFSATVFSAPTLHRNGSLPLNLCIDATLSNDGNTLYCLDQPDDTGKADSVQAIATATGTVERTYPLGAYAFGNVALTPDGNDLYLSLEIPGIPNPVGALEQLNLNTGAIALANTKLFGALAIR